MPKKYSTPGPRLMLPSVCTSVPVSECSVSAQLLFDRLIVQCDDQGRMQGESRVVAALCMPLVRTATERSVTTWLTELADQSLILRYFDGPRAFIQVVGWWENQGTPRRAYPSRYPAPEGWSDRVRMDGDNESADNPPRNAAKRGESPRPNDLLRAYPSLPVPTQLSPPRAVSARENDDGPKAEKEERRRLSEDFKAGRISENDYRRALDANVKEWVTSRAG